MKLNIDEIRVKKRIRTDIGDLDELCRSMQKYGLLNPVTVNKKKILLAGYRRLQAARLLGWHEIECNVVDASSSLDRLEIEAQENTARKDFTTAEIETLDERLTYLRSSFFRKIILLVRSFFRKVFRFFRKLIFRGGSD